jgi:hypothetical protein
LLKIKLNAAVGDMKGSKPRKPLNLVSVWESNFEDVVADLTALPSEVLNWNKPLKLSNKTGDGVFPPVTDRSPRRVLSNFGLYDFVIGHSKNISFSSEMPCRIS